jgi:glycosyltransferase 2 family protein
VTTGAVTPGPATRDRGRDRGRGEGDGAAAAGRRRWPAAALGTGVAVAGTVAVVVAFRSAVGDAAGAVDRAAPGWVAVAAVCLAAGRVGLAATSWTVAAAALTPVAPRAAARVWLRATVAKYLPGGVWQPVSATERLHRAGAPLGAAAAVTAVEVAASAVGGAAVGLAAVPALAGAGGGLAWAPLAALPFVALAVPAVLRTVLGLAARAAGRPDAAVAVPGALVARCALVQAASWVLAGLATSALLAAVGAPAVPGLAVPATALAWLAGFAVVVAPAGLGVREAALTAALATRVPAADALAAAVMSRLVWVVVDGLAAASTLGRRAGKYPGPAP